jgi:hypothetical protein
VSCGGVEGYGYRSSESRTSKDADGNVGRKPRDEKQQPSEGPARFAGLQNTHEYVYLASAVIAVAQIDQTSQVHQT